MQIKNKIRKKLNEDIQIVIDYYGQDKNTSKKSDILEGGRKYKVTSGSKINEIFYEGLTYEDSSNKINL